MLKLRRGEVLGTDPLTVEVGGEQRAAWADEDMVGPVEVGDEVIVNTEALDLGLGSGGFDVVHVNLTRGVDGDGPADEHVMKLNYTSLQHAVRPVEPREEGTFPEPAPPVLVISLHGHLAPAVWAAKQAEPSLEVGFIQSGGGSLPGALSHDVRELRERGLLAAHITAGAAYGGEHEAISLTGGIDAAIRELGWSMAIVGPGPGIVGSDTWLGHGGMAALDAAHCALALRLPTLVCPRLSSSDPRTRHRGLSHHSRTVFELLLATVRVPVPEAALQGWPMLEEGPEGGSPQAALDELIEVCRDQHDITVVQAVDLRGYASSGLPARTMGRTLEEDPLFFAAPLAAGVALRAMVAPE